AADLAEIQRHDRHLHRHGADHRGRAEPEGDGDRCRRRLGVGDVWCHALDQGLELRAGDRLATEWRQRDAVVHANPEFEPADAGLAAQLRWLSFLGRFRPRAAANSLSMPLNAVTTQKPLAALRVSPGIWRGIDARVY